ncbi:MAG TPA: CPBP family intramembrane glutamic endopeptidase [Candidatus Limnocylindrales bacterium]|nr:CPBP family intramembrane glutamic endopeptidase [Candidatus Limnocylindrales bacterium]
MPNYPRRLIFFLLAVLALTCVISPWLAAGAAWIATGWPNLISEPIPFSRIFNRAFMISGILLFVFGWRLLAGAQWKQLLVMKFRLACGDLGTGLGLAIGSMVVLATAMTASHVFEPFFRLSLAESFGIIASAVSAGIFAGALEEVFFRGLLFKGLYDAGRPLRAYLLVNLFYSLLHFVRPGQAYFLAGFEPLAGFRHLFKTFAPFLNPLAILPGIFGLFLIGVVLSYALLRTGKLYLSIGLHAGWIIALKSLRVFGDFQRQDLGWLFGSTDPKIVSGVATLVGLLAVGVAVHYLTRSRSGRSADRLREAAV